MHITCLLLILSPPFLPLYPFSSPSIRRGFSVPGVMFKWRLLQFSAASGPQQKPRGSVWRGRHSKGHAYEHTSLYSTPGVFKICTLYTVYTLYTLSEAHLNTRLWNVLPLGLEYFQSLPLLYFTEWDENFSGSCWQWKSSKGSYHLWSCTNMKFKYHWSSTIIVMLLM